MTPSRLLLPVLVAGGLVATTGPAHAEDPVADDATKAEVVAALAEARRVQDVCYGWELRVSDDETGRYTGSYVLSDSGVGRATDSTCRRRVVLRARVDYTSQSSEAEDSAEWEVTSTGVRAPSADDLDRLGLQAGDLLDDDASELAFVNAVLALPALTADAADDVVPITLEQGAAAPADARATGTPGSDRLRERAWTLALLLVLAVAALVWAATAWWPGVRHGLSSAARAALDDD